MALKKLAIAMAATAAILTLVAIAARSTEGRRITAGPFQKEISMKSLPFLLSLALLGAVPLVPSAMAQKGMGEPGGAARQAEKPPIESMSGTIKDIKTGRCERTTGRSIEGVHLIVQAQDNKTINLHLGPAAALADTIQKLSPGETITFEAFRTDRMPKDAYVAKSLTAGGETFALRNDSLRPKWASRWGKGGGRGMGGGLGQGSCYW